MNPFNDTQIIFSEDLVSRKNDDGTIVLMKMDDSDVFYKINGIAAQIYKKTETNTPLNQIFDEISSKYPNHEEELTKDINNFIEKLKSFNLLCK